MYNPKYVTTTLGRQYLWNVFSYNTNEELKILGNYYLYISATCVRVPVLRSH